MILPKVRDPRFTTRRRGGSLTDDDHRLLAVWAADCAEHVLPFFEANSDDPRPREAIVMARAWSRGEVGMMQARQGAFAANAAGRGLSEPARFAALSAGQAAAVGHVAAHELGAAAYAIRAKQAAAPEGKQAAVGRRERDWQRRKLPPAIRELVLDDQRLRNELCWSVFS